MRRVRVTDRQRDIAVSVGRFEVYGSPKADRPDKIRQLAAAARSFKRQRIHRPFRIQHPRLSVPANHDMQVIAFNDLREQHRNSSSPTRLTQPEFR
jgi:hypothetical protein